MFSSALFRIAVSGFVLTVGACAAKTQIRVAVCLSYAHDSYLNPDAHMDVEEATLTASQIFKRAGVTVNWRTPASACLAHQSRAITITFSAAEPSAEHKEGLAYALPFEGNHIVVFYSRVKAAVSGDRCPVPKLMGYVLAHEITHLLQKCDCHSREGVMKGHWSRHDYSQMVYSLLQWAPEDIDLIQTGPWGTRKDK